MSATQTEIAVKSYINLRHFADASAAAVPVARAGEDPFLTCRVLLPLAQGPITGGTIALAPGSGQVDPMPADEFIIVHKGAMTLKTGDASIRLNAGESLVLTQGVAFSWEADAPVTLIFLRRTGSPAGSPALIPIDESAPLEASGAPLAELLEGPTPACRNHTDYRSEDGEFVCGTWDSTPYIRRSMLYGHYELMHLTQGSVTFEDETGARGTFSKGDIFLIEQGAHCSWDSRDHVKKIYAIYRPA